MRLLGRSCVCLQIFTGHPYKRRQLMPHSIWLLIIVAVYFTALALTMRKARNVQTSQEDQAHNTCGQCASNHQGTTTQAMRGLRSSSDEDRSVGSWAHSPSQPRWADDDPELWALAQKLQSQSWGQARSSDATANSKSA